MDAVRQCAVLVGGMGTRLGDIAAATPKPLLNCGDRPFLAWLLREFIRYGFDDFLLMTGHLSNVVEAALPAIAGGLPKQVRIRCCTEPVRAGTGGAMHHAQEHLAERFLLCNGDSLLDFNLAHLLAAAAGDPDDVIGRITLRRLEDASRYGVVDLQGDHVVAFKERPVPGSSGMINAGIYLFNRSILASIAPVCSLERDVLPVLAEQGALRGTVGQGYFIDIGIQADLMRAQIEIPDRLRRPALFLDGDIMVDQARTAPQGQVAWSPGAVETIQAATQKGHHVFIVASQPWLAGELPALMATEIQHLGGALDDTCGPGPGALANLMARWEIDPSRSVFIYGALADAAQAVALGLTAHRLQGEDVATFVLPLIAPVAHDTT